MRITYDPEVGAGYIYLVDTIPRGGSKRQESVLDGSVIFDFDGEGKMLGVEILAGKWLHESTIAAADQVDRKQQWIDYVFGQTTRYWDIHKAQFGALAASRATIKSYIEMFTQGAEGTDRALIFYQGRPIVVDDALPLNVVECLSGPGVFALARV